MCWCTYCASVDSWGLLCEVCTSETIGRSMVVPLSSFAHDQLIKAKEAPVGNIAISVPLMLGEGMFELCVIYSGCHSCLDVRNGESWPLQDRPKCGRERGPGRCLVPMRSYLPSAIWKCFVPLEHSASLPPLFPSRASGYVKSQGGKRSAKPTNVALQDFPTSELLSAGCVAEKRRWGVFWIWGRAKACTSISWPGSHSQGPC